MGSGLEGMIADQKVRVGSQQLIFGAHKPDDWAVRALRRASWRSALSIFVSVNGRTIGGLPLEPTKRQGDLPTRFSRCGLPAFRAL